MSDEINILNLVQTAAAKKILFLPHAIRQMSRPERLIATDEVRLVIKGGEIVEDYPEDVRGHSCLMLGFGENGRAIHIVCSPKEAFLAVITAYLPNDAEWADDFRTRITQ